MAWAALIDRKVGMGELRLALELMDLQREAQGRATLRGHNVEKWLRVENARAIARCTTCGARLYLDKAQSPPVMDGDVFERDCL